MCVMHFCFVDTQEAAGFPTACLLLSLHVQLLHQVLPVVDALQGIGYCLIKHYHYRDA